MSKKVPAEVLGSLSGIDEPGRLADTIAANMPLLVIAPNKGHYDKVVSNIEEIKARKGRIIAVVTEGDEDISRIADFVIPIPETDECFTPLLTTIPLQLLAYHMAVMRGCDVDQPRNLAKSVTVE